MQIIQQAVGTAFADGIGYHHAAGWGWAMMAGWWLVVITLIVLVARALPSGGWRGGAPTADAESILARRFASGDIDADEYNTRRAALRT
ncbi:MAG: SHOCT domain-containing protein [Actinomycetota bacterium]